MRARSAFFSNAAFEIDSDLTSGVLSLFSIHPSWPNFNMNFGHVHCHHAFDKLMIPNFALAGSALGRNHGLTTFVHERLEWTLADQSSEKSETEWLCVVVAGYKIINIYKPPPSRLTPTAIPAWLVCKLATSNANMSTGATTKHLMTVNNRHPGQQPTTLVCCKTHREQPVSSLIDGTSSVGQGQPTAWQTFVFQESFRGHDTDPPS